MNEYDSERLCGYLVKNGWKQIENYSGADLVILNTCSIREKATFKLSGVC